MTAHLSRREWLAAGVAARTALAQAPTSAAAADRKEPFVYSLNTSTIRGQNLTLVEEIDIAAKAGYQAVEPWVPKIETFVKGGGSLKAVAKRVRDHGLTVESAIGFAEWIVDDDARRKRGLEQAKRDMDWVSQLGGRRIAAPPAGATQQADLNLFRAAERYRALLEIGEQFGVTPQVEVWGFSKCLSRLGETTLVALECGHPKACILPDVYHLFKGGSDFHGLKLLSGVAVQVFHVNDYPAGLPRPTAKDADRVYPGDGVAPWQEILRGLYAAGFRGVLSLELFNPTYWKQDALTVARTGLEKTKAVVRSALE